MYTNWLEGEPNNVVRDNVREDCVHIWGERSYKWNDLQCTDKYYFICEIESRYFTNSYLPS